VLRQIAKLTFSPLGVQLDGSGLPVTVKGSEARATAAKISNVVAGVFGKGWDSEIKLPPTLPGAGGYSVDFVLVAVDPIGTVLSIVPVEVQTIDTTNSYKASVNALRANRTIVPSTFGMNWENVNKRILPQLIIKGLMLQAERLCAHGIFFVTPKPVYDRIMLRLGGEARLREIPRQPGSITFVRLDYHGHPQAGNQAALATLPLRTISTSDMSLAFITPENLPPAGSYETLVRARIR
jgi:hypothetical protein